MCVCFASLTFVYENSQGQSRQIDIPRIRRARADYRRCVRSVRVPVRMPDRSLCSVAEVKAWEKGHAEKRASPLHATAVKSDAAADHQKPDGRKGYEDLGVVGEEEADNDQANAQDQAAKAQPTLPRERAASSRHALTPQRCYCLLAVF